MCRFRCRTGRRLASYTYMIEPRGSRTATSVRERLTMNADDVLCCDVCNGKLPERRCEARSPGTGKRRAVRCQCLAVWYCSTKCQKRHFASHKRCACHQRWRVLCLIFLRVGLPSVLVKPCLQFVLRGGCTSARTQRRIRRAAWRYDEHVQMRRSAQRYVRMLLDDEDIEATLRAAGTSVTAGG